jgi:hypothetical protein
MLIDKVQSTSYLSNADLDILSTTKTGKQSKNPFLLEHTYHLLGNIGPIYCTMLLLC